MKRSLISLIMLVGIILLAGQVYGQTEITTSGEIRVRCEFDDKSFSKDDPIVHTTFLRTKLNIKAEINDNTSTFIQFQDSRRFGDVDAFENRASGALNDGESVDLHQAYFKVNHLWDNGLGLKAGRFEVNLGNERVFGAVGWSNVGRVWDGTNCFYNAGTNEFNGYWLRPSDLFDTTKNSDFDIWGLSGNFKALHLEAFAFLETDAKRIDSIITVDTTAQDYNNLQRFNIGMYYWRDHKQFDIKLNLVYQMGKQHSWTDDGIGGVNSIEKDIAAYMVNFEAGYTFAGDMKPRLAAGIDLTSGSKSTDVKNKTYNNLYYTGHKFRGYMDYFVAPDPDNPMAHDKAGLMDIIVRGQISPVEGWTVKGDFHLFSTAVEYNNGTENTKDLGSEFDLTIATSNISGIKFNGGFSYFMPKTKWKNNSGDADKDNSMWFWWMGTVVF